ncbi:MAG: polysaccharide biosynthesis/export family protein [Silvibacterium sp.]
MAKNKFALIFVLLLAYALPSAFAWGQRNTYQNTYQTTEISQVPLTTIGPGDALDVEVFDTPELSLPDARVNQNGQVNLPVLGIVDIAGLNATQAARKIEAELRAHGLMLDPHVTVSVVEYAGQGATFLGEIKAPGVYPTRGNLRLLDMIAMAGGLLPTAGKIVTIAHRDDPQHPVAIALVPNAQALGSQQNPVIQPGDTVVVGRAGIVYILGAVNKPGGFLIDNNEHISLMQALTLAGGWDKAAALSKVRLIRKVPGGHKELMLDLKHVLNGRQADVMVQNDDILYVPPSLGKTVAYRGLEAIITAAQTSVIYAGAQ